MYYGVSWKKISYNCFSKDASNTSRDDHNRKALTYPCCKLCANKRYHERVFIAILAGPCLKASPCGIKTFPCSGRPQKSISSPVVIPIPDPKNRKQNQNRTVRARTQIKWKLSFQKISNEEMRSQVREETSSCKLLPNLPVGYHISSTLSALVHSHNSLNSIFGSAYHFLKCCLYVIFRNEPPASRFYAERVHIYHLVI